MADASGLTPLILAGQLARPIPLSFMRRLAAPVFRRWVATWSGPLSNRLCDQTGILSIRPVGWPLCFDLHVGEQGPGSVSITLERPEDSVPTARVTATPEVLLKLMAAEDGPDGDGAFFSRALHIEGDTGLVMAFRYAIEDTGLNLHTLKNDLPRPFIRALEVSTRRLEPVHDRFSRDLAKMQELLLSPVRSEIARLNTRLKRLESAGTGPRRAKVVSRKELANG
ncbi:SCP2 sterol-binding domain-containing protein [Phaeovibrio sulfidiphilus]|uniref:SCP2 sterol-binding domain-containing protein n=1 Tax=Phaeovibrio sulfidiphilus TaxID=1220600 RepID=A0A8J7CCT5_9PROT|nr:SCP2 sterol-binding domain-containing protein [Phaeovibrio sulfidiphilus]MBE1236109.1 SCP2 sterol-binding domain-containing protein [Phaeovibrio sulfidiphilus]